MTAEAARPQALSELMTDPLGDERGTSLWQGAFQRLRRNPCAIIGAVIVAVFVLIAVFAPLIAPYEPATSEWINEVTPADVPGPSPDTHSAWTRSARTCSPSWSTARASRWSSASCRPCSG